MKINQLTLRVRDLDLMLRFYQEIFGLQVNLRSSSADGMEEVELGFKGRFKEAVDPLLILKHDPKARDTPHDFAGLYHFAVLVPDRKSLAHAYTAIESQYRFDGFADHLVSESLYLHDPERNGIEIYRDRPSHQWNRGKNGTISIDTLPLDLSGVLDELKGESTSAAFQNGARIGHMHLRVINLERSAKFYREQLGFDLTADLSSMGAMFLSYGGYHHHIGLNTWHSLDGKQHETGEAGLESFTIDLTGDEDLLRKVRMHSQTETLADPDGIQIEIKK